MVTPNLDRPLETSPVVSDEIRYTTCYMCACRCGIRVHMKDGTVRYIDGNPNHPVNKGVLCGKGSAGIMTLNSPARLTNPLRRVGPRGSGEFEEVSWEEAIETAKKWLQNIRSTDPRKLAFFTGRDQSQGLTSWWAQQFGTPNYAAHGGFCSVNMAAAGLYTIGSAFWEFGEPDWELTRFFMMFGVAEDHDSNPIKMGLGHLKTHGGKFVSVNPVRTGYSAIADEWIGITPGTDGLFVFALIHELLRAGKVDANYLSRYTNASWLVYDEPGTVDHGLFVRDPDGNPQCWDRETGELTNPLLNGSKPALKGNYMTPDKRNTKPAFVLLAERYLDAQYSPDAVAERTGVPAVTIKRLAVEIAEVAFEQEIEIDVPWVDWVGRHHSKMIGRPVSMHAMRGISAHSNGFHTCRAIHVLQILLGSIDVPGGMRYKAPYPKGLDSLPKPTGKREDVRPNTPLPGPHLGFVRSPEDLLVDAEGNPQRIDKAFSWDAPMSAHGLMHMVTTNAWQGDPFKIDTLFYYMANMAWNSAMNTTDTINMFTDKDDDGEYKIPHIIYSDAFYSEMVPYADLILPDTTYLERYDCISLLDRPICDADGAADSIRHPVVQPDRNVRPFQDVLIDLGARLGLEGLVNDDGTAKYPNGYKEYMVLHERKPGIGPLAGWRGADGSKIGCGEPNLDQLNKYIDNQCFWRHELDPNQRYFKNVNANYLNFAKNMGFVASSKPIILQVYAEELQTFRLAADGHGSVKVPEKNRNRIKNYFDPLPIWYPPFEDIIEGVDEYPMHAITQRPMAMYHSWGSQNAWLRQIHGENRLYISRERAGSLGLADDEWAWVSSRNGRIKVQVRLMDGVNPNTVWTWNAIGKRSGAWNLKEGGREAKSGFLMNHLIDELLPEQPCGYRFTNSDPVTGQAAWYDLRVRVERADQTGPKETFPQFPPLAPKTKVSERVDISRFGKSFRAGQGND